MMKIIISQIFFSFFSFLFFSWRKIPILTIIMLYLDSLEDYLKRKEKKEFGFYFYIINTSNQVKIAIF